MSEFIGNDKLIKKKDPFSLSKENDKKLIGAKETMLSKSFSNRISVKKSIKYSDCGNGKKHLYQWSDYKTSLLCKQLNKDSSSNFDQQLFIQKMIINILVVLRVDINDVLKEYMKELQTAKQKEDSRSYPVCQSQVWKGDSRKVWNNMYGLINFLKWIWVKLYKGRFYDPVICDDSSLRYYVLIETIQQMMFKVQSNIKGPRKNEKNSNSKSNNVGISDIVTDDLERSINEDEKKSIEKWLHPGKSQCFVPYFGGYGAEIKKYRQYSGDNKYSSLQCGISGSVNYFIFLYLLSTIVSEDKSLQYNPKRLLILMTIILGGDGGHTVREVIFGTATVVILLSHLISDILDELRKQYKNYNLSFKEAVNILKDRQDFSWIKNSSIIGLLLNRITINIGDKLDKCKNVKTKQGSILHMLLLVLNAFSNWEKPVNELYKLTYKMNIVGIDSKDITDAGYDLSTINFSYFKKQTYEVLFEKKHYNVDPVTKKVIDIDLANSVQLFYALENDRYLGNKKDTFKKAPDKCMTDIINYMYDGIYDKVNDKAKKHLLKCNPNSKMKHIPFA